ncbi:MAG: 2-oxo acid dehydrogenase subunit E2 [Dehalococcoidia bacterium]
MATDVVMPKLGMTMVEGTVEEWLAEDGATVASGQPIFRLVTEKVNFEVEAETGGVLRHAVAAGSTVPTGQLIAYLLTPGEEPPSGFAAPIDSRTSAATSTGAVTNDSAQFASRERVRATPAARRLARDLRLDIATVTATGDGLIHEADVRAAHERSATAAAALAQPAVSEIRATPLARRLAEQHGVDLHSISGSGPAGRIVQEDVERRISEGTSDQLMSSAGAHVPAGVTIPLSGIRRTIAERMHASLHQMAQLTINTEADATELVKLRHQLVEEWQNDGVRPSYTDLVIKAVAHALRAHPRVNASLDGDVIRLHDRIHIGMAVALDEGLLVPVLHDADRLPLKRVVRETSALAERARTGTLSYDDIAGGTFSVTSLGMYEVDTFTPIINPPQVAILGVGRVRDSVRLSGQEVVAGRVIALSLTIDHRVLDGAPAAEFLRRIKHLLERPYLLFMDDE